LRRSAVFKTTPFDRSGTAWQALVECERRSEEATRQRAAEL
jgi:hypothetical protein